LFFIVFYPNKKLSSKVERLEKFYSAFGRNFIFALVLHFDVRFNFGTKHRVQLSLGPFYPVPPPANSDAKRFNWPSSDNHRHGNF